MPTSSRKQSRLRMVAIPFIIAMLLLILLPISGIAGQIPDEIIVRLKPGKLSKLSTMTFGTGIETKRAIDKLGFCTLKLPKGTDLEQTIARLSKDPSVEYAGPNHLLHIVTVDPIEPDDPVYYSGDEFWGIPQWGLDAIEAPMAWNVTTGSPSVVIAVIDSGIDFTHPDLMGKIRTNPNETPNNGIDDDHNGYVDDVQGWDFVGDDSYPTDDNEIYHGSLISGIAAASSDNGVGIAGVSWGSPVLPLKVVGADGYGTEDDAAAAVMYAVAMGVKVINMSLAGDDAPALHAAVDYAWDHGAICVCASGNDGRLKTMFPAGYDRALAVGATDEYDARWSGVDPFTGATYGSNYGSYLDVMAPGSYIVSTGRFLEDLGLVYEPYDTESGTSAAAPFVSGVAALIWSAHPTWTNEQVVYQITHTVDEVGVDGWDIETGWGRVNAYRAVTEQFSEAQSVGAVKQMTSGPTVALRGKVLSTSSGNLPGRLYVQDGDRSSGILLSFVGTVPSGLVAGNKVDVMGRLGTFNGECAILDPIVTKTSDPISAPKPLGMTNRAMGGGKFGLQGEVVDEFYAPQKFSVGRNNTGLLVTVWGKVTRSTYGLFYIDDGALLEDGTGDVGVRVDCGSLAPPRLGAWVAVTGISGCEVPAGATIRRRVLRPRVQNDINIIKAR